MMDIGQNLPQKIELGGNNGGNDLMGGFDFGALNP
jgi:hypothetical protein